MVPVWQPVYYSKPYSCGGRSKLPTIDVCYVSSYLCVEMFWYFLLDFPYFLSLLNPTCITFIIINVMLMLNIWLLSRQFDFYLSCLQYFVRILNSILIDALHLLTQLLSSEELQHYLLWPHPNPRGCSCLVLEDVQNRRWTSWRAIILFEKLKNVTLGISNDSSKTKWRVQELGCVPRRPKI